MQAKDAARIIAEQTVEIDRLRERLDRVLNDWAGLDELVDALQEKLAVQETALRKYAGDSIETAHQINDMRETLATREFKVEKYAGQYLAAAQEARELQHQLGVAQREVQGMQAAALRQSDSDDAKAVALLIRLLDSFDDVEESDDRVISAKRLLASHPDARETRHLVKETLTHLLQSWDVEMQQIPERLAEFKTTWLVSLDAQIAEIKLHKKVLGMLDDLDKETWQQALFTRRALNSVQADVIRHGDLAKAAICTARLVLEQGSSPETVFSSIGLAYDLIAHTRDLEQFTLRSFGAGDIEVDLLRITDSVQFTINRFVASGTRYTVARDDEPAARTHGASWFTIPEPQVWTSTVCADDDDDFAPLAQPAYSIEPEFPEPDPFTFNPANGMPMHDGIGGVDVYGNTFGSDLNDPW
jgi:hypothetical protein